MAITVSWSKIRQLILNFWTIYRKPWLMDWNMNGLWLSPIQLGMSSSQLDRSTTRPEKMGKPADPMDPQARHVSTYRAVRDESQGPRIPWIPWIDPRVELWNDVKFCVVFQWKIILLNLRAVQLWWINIVESPKIGISFWLKKCGLTKTWDHQHEDGFLKCSWWVTRSFYISKRCNACRVAIRYDGMGLSHVPCVL